MRLPASGVHRRHVGGRSLSLTRHPAGQSEERTRGLSLHLLQDVPHEQGADEPDGRRGLSPDGRNGGHVGEKVPEMLPLLR